MSDQAYLDASKGRNMDTYGCLALLVLGSIVGIFMIIDYNDPSTIGMVALLFWIPTGILIIYLILRYNQKKIKMRTIKDYEKVMQCRCGGKMTYSEIKWNLEKKVAEFMARCLEKGTHKEKRAITPEILMKCAPEDMVADFYNSLVELERSYKGRGIDSDPVARVKFVEILKKFESQTKSLSEKTAMTPKKKLNLEQIQSKIQKLSRNLTDSDPVSRLMGIHEIVLWIQQHAEYKDQVINLLEPLLSDSDMDVRETAAESIALLQREVIL